MKVTLINPGKEHEGNLDARSAAPPLGLLYIASNLIEHGHEVMVIDQLGSSLSDEELINDTKSFNPELIGFSTMGSQTISAGRVTTKLKEALPNAKVLWGGINPTFSAEQIMKKYLNVDFCLKGEGELSIIELINSLKNKAFDTVHGLVYRLKNAVKEGLPRRLIDKLDSLPFPKRELVKNIKYGSISGIKLDKFTSVLSSRGCPYTCKYCCCNALVNKRWRGRSVDNVLEELKLIEDQGYENVLFFDDGLTLNNKRVIEICKGIRNQGLNLNWFFEGRVDNARVEVYSEAVKAGAKICYFGVESANAKALNYYDKHINPGQAVNAVKMARKAGMDFIVGSFILGCPGERERDIERTIKLITKLDIDFPQVTNLIAYPGTDLWNSMVNNGYLDPEKYWETGIGINGLHPHALPYDFIKEKVRESYARFLASNKVKAKHVWRLIKSGFRQKVFWQNLKYFDKDMLKKLIGG